MTDYRSRLIKAILVPSDEKVQIGKLEEDTIQNWLTRANFDWMGFVHGQLKELGVEFTMIIDDEGHDNRLPWNPRAQFLSGYPLDAPILGDALFVSRDWRDDGYDVVDLIEPAAKWIKNGMRASEFRYWLDAPENRDYNVEYRMKYPQPVSPPPVGTLDWSKPDLRPKPLQD